jgi:ElaB/YqjD/DUF883 family membrane-anchored ribosome-binding protein
MGRPFYKRYYDPETEERLMTYSSENQGSAKGDIRESAGKVRDDLQGLAHDAGTAARHYVEIGQENISTLTKSMASSIQRKPIQSGAIAVGLGMLLGMMMRRR